MKNGEFTPKIVTELDWNELQKRMASLEAQVERNATLYAIAERRYDELLRQFALLEKRTDTLEQMVAQLARRPIS